MKRGLLAIAFVLLLAVVAVAEFLALLYQPAITWMIVPAATCALCFLLWAGDGPVLSALPLTLAACIAGGLGLYPLWFGELGLAAYEFAIGAAIALLTGVAARGLRRACVQPIESP